jgi:hypothetical protein
MNPWLQSKLEKVAAQMMENYKLGKGEGQTRRLKPLSEVPDVLDTQEGKQLGYAQDNTQREEQRLSSREVEKEQNVVDSRPFVFVAGGSNRTRDGEVEKPSIFGPHQTDETANEGNDPALLAAELDERFAHPSSETFENHATGTGTYPTPTELLLPHPKKRHRDESETQDDENTPPLGKKQKQETNQSLVHDSTVPVMYQASPLSTGEIYHDTNGAGTRGSTYGGFGESFFSKIRHQARQPTTYKRRREEGEGKHEDDAGENVEEGNRSREKRMKQVHKSETPKTRPRRQCANC